MAEKKIIRSLRKKDELGNYGEQSFLGSESRFVSALKGSNNNNIEEQFLQGTDSVRTDWTETENNVNRTQIKYYDNNQVEPDEYYILESYSYIVPMDSSDFIAENESLMLADNEGVNSVEETDGSLTYYGSDLDVYSTDGFDTLIEPPKITRVDVLQYKNTTEIITVSQKVTQSGYNVENKEIIKTSIVNYL